MASLALTALALAVAAAFIVTAYRRRWNWTGFSGSRAGDAEGQRPAPPKSLWDWLQLLIVPVALALAAYGLNTSQANRDSARDDARAKQQIFVAEDRAREDALRTYLQQMSGLITDHGLRSQAGGGSRTSDAQALARTLTLAALRRLDGERKGLVVQFLWESGLIDHTARWRRTARGWKIAKDSSVDFGFGSLKVDLSKADLTGVVLRGADLTRGSEGSRVIVQVGPALEETDLRHADFRNAIADGASFAIADLRHADFSGASLGGAALWETCLSGARFVKVEFRGLAEHGWLGADLTYAEGQGVDFSDATLDYADFRGSVLTQVNLHGASTRNTRFPRRWTASGLRPTRPHPGARELCQYANR